MLIKSIMKIGKCSIILHKYVFEYQEAIHCQKLILWDISVTFSFDNFPQGRKSHHNTLAYFRNDRQWERMSPSKPTYQRRWRAGFRALITLSVLRIKTKSKSSINTVSTHGGLSPKTHPDTPWAAFPLLNYKADRTIIRLRSGAVL